MVTVSEVEEVRANGVSKLYNRGNRSRNARINLSFRGIAYKGLVCTLSLCLYDTFCKTELVAVVATTVVINMHSG
ncbi:hypothetical protein BC936DRAFT_140359 [Jimgerdemannia flammicorona]|uniref:Uncharacterized protein n=1 Tax=Jimgerdemannia flammicorona TaxID=994334 RepID=A0A433AUK2_9FUNG|nr:hypothetical protein BC936DRAFT_140359 [Jimgerdemannia flammicorona]